uniref:Putative product n=1 Tax=Xenopsylla cheopis TaxID=163159 RepID=A0A6M2DUP6_XENCH
MFCSGVQSTSPHHGVLVLLIYYRPLQLCFSLYPLLLSRPLTSICIVLLFSINIVCRLFLHVENFLVIQDDCSIFCKSSIL